MTKIEWVKNRDGSQGETWNPIVGCSVVSPGCTNCYAMWQAARIRRMQKNPPDSHYFGTTKIVNGNAVWTGKVALAPDRVITAPLRRKKPTTYFVNSMGDLFHDGVPDEWVDRVFAVMALGPQHTFMVLTKRSGRMREYIQSRSNLDDRGNEAEDVRAAMTALVGTPSRREMAPTLKIIPLGKYCAKITWPLPNVMLGVTAEDQKHADARIPDLLATPAAKRFVSIEPMLGPVDLTKLIGTTCLAYSGACCGDKPWLDALRGIQGCSRAGAYSFPDRNGFPRGLDLVICGGESGPGARPMHPDWARSLRDQCTAVGVPFMFKQWGEWSPTNAVFNKDGSGAAYPMKGCCDPSKHTDSQECLFWSGKSGFVQWPYLPDGLDETIGARRVGKHRAGRLLDGVEHNWMPERD